MLGRAFLALAIGLSVLIFSTWLIFSPEWVGVDYTSFYEAARHPVADIYSRKWSVFIYPPTGIAVVQPFGWFGYWPGYVLLTVLSVAAFFVAVRRVSDWRVALVSLLSYPALQGLGWGQVSMLFASGLLFALTLPEARRGLLIGAMAALKPQIFLAAPFVFMVRREWETLLGFCCGGIWMVAASLIFFGIGPWIEWLKFAPTILPYMFDNGVINYAIGPIGWATAHELPILPFALAGVAFAAWLVSRSPSQEPIALMAIIGGASVIVAPYALPHDAVLIMPLVASVLLGNGALVAKACAVGAFALIAPVATIPAFFVALRAWSSDHLEPSVVRADGDRGI